MLGCSYSFNNCPDTTTLSWGHQVIIDANRQAASVIPIYLRFTRVKIILPNKSFEAKNELKENKLSGSCFRRFSYGSRRIFREVRTPYLVQISNTVFCDDFIAGLKLQNRLLPNPYQDFPFLLIEGFIPPESVHAIARHCSEHSQSEQARIKTSQHGAIIADVNERIRKTAIHTLPDLLLEAYHHAFEMHQPLIERFFNAPLTTATEVQALEYTKGGFYIKHADDSNELVDAQGNTVGFNLVAPERKITTVLFATSYGSSSDPVTAFEGGELCFNYLYDASGAMITLRPKAGDMIVFPSNPIFSHEVKTVRSGYRLTLVRWHNALA